MYGNNGNKVNNNIFLCDYSNKINGEKANWGNATI